MGFLNHHSYHEGLHPMAQKYPALITMFHIFGVRQAQKLSALDAEASDARVGKLGFSGVLVFCYMFLLLEVWLV